MQEQELSNYARTSPRKEEAMSERIRIYGKAG